MALDNIELLSVEEIDEKVGDLNNRIKEVKGSIAFEEVSKSVPQIYQTSKTLIDAALTDLNKTLETLRADYSAFMSAIEADPFDYI